jgi:hypothetical protein
MREAGWLEKDSKNKARMDVGLPGILTSESRVLSSEFRSRVNRVASFLQLTPDSCLLTPELLQLLELASHHFQHPAIHKIGRTDRIAGPF